MNKNVLVLGALLAIAVLAIAPIAPAMAWEAETDGKEKACAKLFELVAKGVPVSPKAIAKVCSG